MRSHLHIIARESSISAASIGLRALGLLAKFVLLIALSRSFSTDEVGYYGLMVSLMGVAYALYSFAFYNHTFRSFVATSPQEQAAMLRDQGVFFIFSYVSFTPIFLCFFLFGTLSWSDAGWFFLIAALEHFGQETYRLLLLFKRPILAMVSLFMRTGLWAFIVSGLIFSHTIPAPALSLIWVLWCICGLLAFLPLIPWLKRLPWREATSRPVNWPWIRGGVKVSLHYIGVAFCVRFTSFFDIFLISHFVSLSAAGVYTLYIGLFRAIQTLVQTGTTSILMPDIIHAHKTGEKTRYRHLQRRLFFSITALSLCAGGALLILIEPLLSFIGKSEFTDNKHLLYWLLPAMLLSNLLTLPANTLYVNHRDREALTTEIAITLLFAIMSIALISTYGLEGAAISIVITSASALTIKSVYAWRRGSTRHWLGP